MKIESLTIATACILLTGCVERRVVYVPAQPQTVYAPAPAQPNPATAPVPPAPDSQAAPPQVAAVQPPATPPPAPPPPTVTMAYAPDYYVWDGNEYVGVVNGQYVYWSGGVWIVAPPAILVRFHGWERYHPYWHRHATPYRRYHWR